MADSKMTYGKYKQQRQQKRHEEKTKRLEKSHERLQRILGPKLYRPQLVKHPTEDREITYRQWKHAQLAIIAREQRLYREMKIEHSIVHRTLVWMSHPERRITMFDRVHMKVRRLTREEIMQRKTEWFEQYQLSQVWFWEGVFGLAKLSYKVPLFYGQLLVKGARYIAPRINYLEWYDRTHITRFDRRTMQRLNLTEEEMFARKADYYEAVRLGRQFWVPPINLIRYVTSAIKTLVNNIRNSTRK